MDNDIKAADNSRFAIGGVSCSADNFVVKESSVLRINICGEKPAHRKSAKRLAKGGLMYFGQKFVRYFPPFAKPKTVNTKPADTRTVIFDDF